MKTPELADLVELTREAQDGKKFEVGKNTYFVDGDGLPTLVKDPGVPERTVAVHTLDGLIEFIKYEETKFDGLRLRVDGPTKVYYETGLDKFGRRPIIAKAVFDAPAFNYGEWYDSEEMNIELQSKFVQNDDRDTVLKVIGNLREEGVTQANDDGVSQKVQINSGVATVANVKVPNPVTLKPYATFLEVDQPERKFIFRMHEGMQSGLFEADGGLWKLVAAKSVKEYLENALEKAGKSIPVIA